MALSVCDCVYATKQHR